MSCIRVTLMANSLDRRTFLFAPRSVFAVKAAAAEELAALTDAKNAEIASLRRAMEEQVRAALDVSRCTMEERVRAATDISSSS